MPAYLWLSVEVITNRVRARRPKRKKQASGAFTDTLDCVKVCYINKAIFSESILTMFADFIGILVIIFQTVISSKLLYTDIRQKQ